MDAVVAPPPPAETRDTGKRDELLLDALRTAIASPGEARLFRWGKLIGLFPGRTGPSAAAATLAVRDGLLETVRTETKGKLVVEWVRATPKAVTFLADHDSPRATLREMRDLLGQARAGVPLWMHTARDEAAQLALRFEQQSREMLRRLDALAERVEAALRRADAARPGTTDGPTNVVPWAEAALEHLDRRSEAGGGWCRLPDLFRAVRESHPDLGLPAFHDGMRRLADVRVVQLAPPRTAGDLTEPEYAVVLGGVLMWMARR